MLKVAFLKRLGLAAIAAPLALAGKASPAAAAVDSDQLVGMWDADVVAKDGTYKYVYAMAPGSYVATGNVDENFQGFRFGPTMGAYAARSDRSYTYREQGWAFDLKGTNVGWFVSTGTFRLRDNGSTFAGPGTYTQYDLHGKTVFSESYTLHAKRVAI